MQGADTSEHDTYNMSQSPVKSERLPPIFRFLNLNHGQDTRANLSVEQTRIELHTDARQAGCSYKVQ